MVLMKVFGPYEPMNTLKALLGPETEFSTLTEMINFQIF